MIKNLKMTKENYEKYNIEIIVVLLGAVGVSFISAIMLRIIFM